MRPLRPSDERYELVRFFKALADENRLKIVGLLAEESRSVEDLAAHLGLEGPTVSHHLRALTGVGVVRPARRAHQRIYELDVARLEDYAGALLDASTFEKLRDGTGANTYEQKVVATYVHNGWLGFMPSQPRKRRVLLRWAAQHFEAGRSYDASEVDSVLAELYDDPEGLRRELVSARFLLEDEAAARYVLGNLDVPMERPAVKR